MTGTPIVLNLYDRESNEIIKTYSQVFVPWKQLKASIRLNKRLGNKPLDQLEEEDIDALTSFVLGIFPSDLTVEMLDEHADLSEMMAVMQNISSRARGVMDPTSPPKAKAK